MPIRMSKVPVEQVFLDVRAPEYTGDFEFTIDCGAIYFGAVYDHNGTLKSIDQYFYTENFSRDDLEDSLATNDLLLVSEDDLPVKAYLLTKKQEENEWLRFHAVVPDAINPDYYFEKYRH